MVAASCAGPVVRDITARLAAQVGPRDWLLLHTLMRGLRPDRTALVVARAGRDAFGPDFGSPAWRRRTGIGE